MSASPPRAGSVALFLLKFAVAATALLGLWWWAVQPAYVALAGQAAGLIIRLFGVSIAAMNVSVDPAGVLSTKTSLVYTHDNHPTEIQVAFLVANLPAYVALIVASPGLSWRRRLKAIGIGSAILFAGHVVFLAVMFTFAHQVRGAPEIPTAFGLLVMTLPFPLWIALAYWDRAASLIGGASPDSSESARNAE